MPGPIAQLKEDDEDTPNNFVLLETALADRTFLTFTESAQLVPRTHPFLDYDAHCYG
jgi:hypothetical protein